MSDLQFVTNAITKAERRTGPDGREYLVAPGVALVAGVVGDEYVPAEEIAKAAFGFNGRPLPLFHPMEGGHYVSANSPDMDSKLSVGRFWNASFDGEKLRGEYWIDIAKAQAMGGEALMLLQALQSNRQVETSTAYGRDLGATPGEYEGKAYAGIARNLVPDHVAVLVNERGKCSIADGCGLLANSCGCGCTSGNQSIKENMMDKNKQPGTEPAEGTEQAPEVAVNAAELATVNAELATVKGELSKISALLSDLGGVEKVREIIQLAHANSQAMAANAKREKDGLINALVGNSRCAFGKADLEKFDIEALGKLAQSLQPVDYSGRTFAANRLEVEPDELVELEELMKEAK